MESVLLVLSDSVFSHRHNLSVALRVRDASKVDIFTRKDSVITIPTHFNHILLNRQYNRMQLILLTQRY